MSPSLQLAETLVTGCAEATRRAVGYLLSRQDEKGYWWGDLTADTTLESDYILLHTLLGTGDPGRFQKAANWIIQHQNEDGGWSIYAGGPANISACVKAYFALRSGIGLRYRRS